MARSVGKDGLLLLWCGGKNRVRRLDQDDSVSAGRGGDGWGGGVEGGWGGGGVICMVGLGVALWVARWMDGSLWVVFDAVGELGERLVEMGELGVLFCVDLMLVFEVAGMVVLRLPVWWRRLRWLWIENGDPGSFVRFGGGFWTFESGSDWRCNCACGNRGSCDKGRCPGLNAMTVDNGRCGL